MSDLPNYMQRRGPFDPAPELTFECRYGCKAAFSLESSLKAHENTHTRPYMTFSDHKLQDHIESFHYNTNRHRCPTCDFAGSTQSSLTKHRKTTHGFTQGAIQTKDYATTMYSPKKRTPAFQARLPPTNARPALLKSSGDDPSILRTTLSDCTSGVTFYPPPIRVLENDIINWPTSPPRKK
ncbi:hypothetical protein BDZ94DRAFT_1347175 [Collybia nuda]|uniref:C2H2-type domain-containing protein n=1 Tax=Collybia nuda TaxID=64659 RepID=A0A9P5YB41_9AGAR|nr:hypothetical protein BDZ94DRAFT_1347175 [Collybia nuda]